MAAGTGPDREFVGRRAELAGFDELLAVARRGEGAAAYVAGEPGIGKTALIAELVARAEEAGVPALSGRAAEFERDLPFGVFIDALDRGLRGRRDVLDGLAPEDLTLLAAVLPAVAGHASAAPVADERHRLLRALRALLGALAADAPLLLALDDLHWADPASIDLACHLLHRGLPGPIVLVLASRPGQSETRLMAALEEADRHGLCQRLELRPMSPDEVGELLGEGVDAPLREALFRESGGNPFYAQQLAAAAQRGAFVERGVVAQGVPPAVSTAIREEIEALSPLGRVTLQAAAVIGEPFEPDVVADTAGVAEGEVLGVLDELTERGLVRPAETPRRFRFRHPIVARAVYESAGHGWRLAAHGRAAAALEARGASATARAHHVEASARVGDEAAVAVLTQAGQETASHAPASAARWFGAALRLLPERPDDLGARLPLVLQRAAVLGLAGEIEESRRALHTFLDLFPAEPTPERIAAALLAAILNELLGDQALGRRLLLEELGRMPDRASAEAAEVERELAFACFFDADMDGTSEWARASLAADGHLLCQVGALSALALAEYGRSDIGAVREHVARAAEIFDALADEQIAGHQPAIGSWLGWAEICTERFDDAVRHLERVIGISRAGGQRHMTVPLLSVQCLPLIMRGRLREASDVAEHAVEAGLLSASNLFLSWAMSLRSTIELQRGDLYAAVRFGERGVSAGAEAGPLAGVGHTHLAEALLELGEAQRCRDQLLSSAGEVDLPAFPIYEARNFEVLCRAELLLGEVDRAEAFAARAAESAARFGLCLPNAQALRARATVLLARGDERGAADAALASAAAADEAGAPIEAARSRTLAGRALALAGDRDAALTALEEAHRSLAEIGAVRFADEAARELRKLGRSVRRASANGDAASPLAGLTKRELEVIELIAAGRTNRDIAEELFLSVRTVDRHVSRIFDKLGVASRAAAASSFERARAEGAG